MRFIKTKTFSDPGPYGQILLVGEHQKESITELVLVQHALQLLTGLDDTIPIIAVNHEDDTLGVLEVVAPQRTNLILTTDIPHGELNVLVFDRLDVESCTRRQFPGRGGGFNSSHTAYEIAKSASRCRRWKGRGAD
jgi:hypothetical protein